MTGKVHGRLLVMFAILLSSAGPAHAQMEGTLFTQPNEREFLDRLRQDFLANSRDAGFNVQEVVIPELAEEAAISEAGPATVNFGGIMNRRDGSHSIWLDGRLLTEEELPDGMSLVTSERSTSLRLVQDGNIFILRPGQTLDLGTGTIIESFQRPQPVSVAETPPTTGTVEEAAVVAETEAVEAEVTATPEVAEIADQGATDIEGLAEQVMLLSEEDAQALTNTIEQKEEEASNAP